MIKELLKSVGKEWLFQYMVLKEYKNRTSSLQHIQRQILDTLKGKCKKKTIKALESSVREYVYDFRGMFLKQDMDLYYLKKTLCRFFTQK